MMSQDGECEESYLLGCDSMLYGRKLSEFQKNLVPIPFL
jgi:hypothetical protein